MDIRKRKRGIKASREKLELAMANAGFTTQLALAKQIAKEENLNTVPKDLVNKVFREQAVSPHNLGRIAKALDVDAHTIYLATQDQSVQDVINTQINEDSTFELSEHKLSKTETGSEGAWSESSAFSERDTGKLNAKISRWFITSSVFIALTLALIIYLVSDNDEADFLSAKVNHTLESTKLEMPLGKVLIVIQAQAHTMDLAVSLADAFSENPDIRMIIPETPDTYSLTASDALRKWQAHGVLRFTATGDGHYQHTALVFTTKRYEADIAQWFMREAERTKNQQVMVDDAKQKTLEVIAGKPLSAVSLYSENSVNEYLLGINALFYSHFDEGFVKAKAHFMRVIDIQPDFAQAHAHLCMIAVRQSYIEDEVPSLEKAAFYCNAAQQYDADNMYTNIAKIEWLSRTGEYDQALNYANALLTPKFINADAYATLAQLYLHVSAAKPEIDYGENVVSLSEQALAIEPSHWRAANTLSNYYFNLGDIKNAKYYLETAAKVVKHDLILANLGTMQMCLDDLAQAQTTYQTIIDSAKENYLAHENLGSVYLMLHEFDKALAQKLLSIEKQPTIAIHQVWSGLAQAYELAGNIKKAYDRYSDALTLLERDELLGNATFSDGLYKIYYKAKLSVLGSEPSDLSGYSDKVDTFFAQRSDLGLKARSHLAWLADKTDNQQAKQQIVNEISAICPVYRRSPELAL